MISQEADGVRAHLYEGDVGLNTKPPYHPQTTRQEKRESPLSSTNVSTQRNWPFLRHGLVSGVETVGAMFLDLDLAAVAACLCAQWLGTYL